MGNIKNILFQYFQKKKTVENIQGGQNFDLSGMINIFRKKNYSR